MIKIIVIYSHTENTLFTSDFGDHKDAWLQYNQPVTMMSYVTLNYDNHMEEFCNCPRSVLKRTQTLYL